MDFDDLEDAIDQRIAEEGPLEGALGLLAASSKQALRAYEPRSYMPPMPRSEKLPRIDDLPAKTKKGLPVQPTREVSLRAFMFYGEGDTFEACARLAASAPAYMEVAVHEWPSHGTREGEPPCASLEELAEDAYKAIKPAVKELGEGGSLEGAPFVLIGSATGALLVAAVGQKLRWDAHVEPSAVIILDRAPPHMPLLSEHGQSLLAASPKEFLAAFTPWLPQQAQWIPAGPFAKMEKAWLADAKLGCDTRKVGSHVFNCDVLVLRGLGYQRQDEGAAVEFVGATLAIGGVAETLTVPVRSDTKISVLRKAVAAACRCDAGAISMATKDGVALGDNDHPSGVTMVTGIKSFKPAPHAWPHPVAVIGAGYNGLKTAMEYLKHGQENITLFDRNDRVGGHCWITAANAQSKIQTEFGSFHIGFGPEYVAEGKFGGPGVWPKGWYTWIKKADVLRHFEQAAEEYGINSHCCFNTNVSELEIVGGATSPDRYYKLKVDSNKGDKSFDFNCSVMYNFPGSMTRNRIVEYPGESEFGGPIGYGMSDEFDYASAEKKNVAIIGNGAFAVENVRSCLEHGANKVYIVTRRKNLASPRLPCWFVHQGPVPTPARMVLTMFEPMYRLCGMGDPWSYWSVHASKDRQNVTIMQNSRFGIGDVTFLAVAYGKLVYVQDTVERMSKHTLHLTTGAKLEDVFAVNKSLGLMGDWSFDKLHQQKQMVGMWLSGDWRRTLSIDATGMNAANFKTFSLGIGVHGGVKGSKYLHDFPEEYYRLEAAGLLQALPVSRADEANDKPAYVTDVKYMMSAGIVLSSMCPQMDAQSAHDGEYMHCLYHQIHKTDEFLEQAVEDWDKYQKMFKDQGNDHEYIKYPYTKEVLSGFFKTFNADLGQEISRDGPGDKGCKDLLDKAMANLRQFDLTEMSRKVNRSLYSDLPYDVTAALRAKEAQAALAKLTFSKPGSATDFDLSQYEEWKEWTSGNCQVVDIEASFMRVSSMKDTPAALEKIFELCKRKQAPPPKA